METTYTALHLVLCILGGLPFRGLRGGAGNVQNQVQLSIAFKKRLATGQLTHWQILLHLN